MIDVSEVIKKKLKEEGFQIYERPFELNIVGLRKSASRPGNFDDELHVFAKVSENESVHHVFNMVTDPGTYWLNKKNMPQKSLMLAQGQYKNSYAIAKKGRSNPYLKEIAPVNIYPAYDRKALFDLFKGKKENGSFNINFLPAKSNGKYLFLSSDMTGSQIFQRKEDFEQFMDMCSGHEKLYGNAFTYTLLDEREYKRSAYRKIGALAGMLLTIISAIVKINKD